MHQKKLITSIILVALVGFIVWLGVTRPDKAFDYDEKMILEALEKHLVLPANEHPTVATIANADELREQPFFTGARTGQVVIIYIKAKRVILYDPEIDRVVDMAALDIDPSLVDR